MFLEQHEDLIVYEFRAFQIQMGIIVVMVFQYGYHFKDG